MPIAVLGVSSSARAATLSVPKPCLESKTIYTITGTGFTPDASVAVSGTPQTLVLPTNGSGSFSLAYLTPNESSFTPRTVILTATDQADPTVTAVATVRIVRFGSNAPVGGLSPRQHVIWRFGGFPGATIYGHFRLHGRTMRNYRFGKATGACGSLVVRARRLPAKVRPGDWTLQIDGRREFSVRTRPAYRGGFSIRG